MEIYYCDKCEGKPYTKDITYSITCPVCNSTLKYDDVSEDSLSDRPVLNMTAKKNVSILKQSIFNNTSGSSQTAESLGCFQIQNTEEFFLYLDFKKNGQSEFECRFIIGNAPDINSVITKTPFIGRLIKFERTIEMEMLEKERICIQEYALSNGWSRGQESFYSFKKDISGVENKNKIEEYNTDIEKQKQVLQLSNNYYIEYKYPSFSDIPLVNPFKRNHTKFLTQLKNVYALQNNEFMTRMFFRSKNGDIVTQLNSIAGAFAILYDDPYANLIRYDRIMKNINCPQL